MFSQWRGCQEYRVLGLPLSTTSNEACKLYDATVTQFVGWYNDESMGGIENTLTGLLSADPQFVMGQVLKNGLNLMETGRNVVLDADLKKDVDAMVTLAQATPPNVWEQQHVQGLKLWADGHVNKACDVWETILLDHPTDVLALKFLYTSQVYLGQYPEMRDSLARCIPAWKQTTPLYGYLLGMYSFALEETNLYNQAEKVGKKALELNPADGWATHALCHVMEMEGRQKEGSEFMETTINNWTKCEMLNCHNYWHWALFYIELNDHKAALDIFDSQVSARCKSGKTMFSLNDSSALLYRLEMEGVDVGDRWNDIMEIARPHIDDHVMAFNDLHILMACLRGTPNDAAKKLMDSLREFVRDGSSDNRKVTQEVALPMCEALVAYEEGEYGKAVEQLYPLRYDIVKVGGSYAQRDIFNLFLIHAALKSPEKHHHKIARGLLMERKALKENSPMTDRLILQALAAHMD